MGSDIHSLLGKAPISLRRKQSDLSLNESSDQKKWESKSTLYQDTHYITMLESKGSFLRDFDHKSLKLSRTSATSYSMEIRLWLRIPCCAMTCPADFAGKYKIGTKR